MGEEMVSVVIPSRNEKYLRKTILDLLEKAAGEVEVIAVLDGYWPDNQELVNHKQVTYIHFSESRGMRAAINAGVSVAKGSFVMKLDAHCMMDKAWDKVLKADCEPNWVVVPRRYSLDPDWWSRKDKPAIDYMYLSSDLHGVQWDEKNRDTSLAYKEIDDLMSFQGSCWFMRKSYFEWLELMDDETYGTFPREAQEIGLKCWLSGGRVIVNKKTWYAHWHKPSDVGRGYSLEKDQIERGTQAVQKWLSDYQRAWYKQTLFLDWLIKKFSPVPTWENYAK